MQTFQLVFVFMKLCNTFDRNIERHSVHRNKRIYICIYIAVLADISVCKHLLASSRWPMVIFNIVSKYDVALLYSGSFLEQACTPDMPAIVIFPIIINVAVHARLGNLSGRCYRDSLGRT